jgi:hypothetical protein
MNLAVYRERPGLLREFKKSVNTGDVLYKDAFFEERVL